MREEDLPIEDLIEEVACESQVTIKKRRNIFRFKGHEDMSINIDHMHKMSLKEKRITFQFSATADFVEFTEEEAAKNAYEQILELWSASVLE